MSAIEHRRSSRRVPRRIKAEFGTESDEKKRVGFTSNLSATGMFVGTNSPYREGTRVQVRLLLEEPLEIETIVVHAKRGMPGVVGAVQSGMGLRILTPEPKLHALLGLTSSMRSQSPAGLENAGKLSFEGSEIEETDEASSPEPSSGETTPKAADLDTRLVEAEAERKRLEDMLEVDEREKVMLRQLVGKLEKTRDRLAGQLADAKAEGPESVNEQSVDAKLLAEAITKQTAAEGVADRLGARVSELEVELANAIETSSTEPPRQNLVGRLGTRGPWMTLALGAALGGLAVWLAGLLGILSVGGDGGSLEVARAAAKNNAEVLAATAPLRSDGSDGSEGPVAGKLEEPEAADSESLAEAKTPVQTSEEEPLPSDVDPLLAAIEEVRAWAAAWSEQRVDDYLSTYSTSFEPLNGLTRGQWRDQRRERLGRPRWIKVDLDSIDASSPAKDRAVLTFEQSYETPTYKDRVLKTLELVLEEGGWRIVREVTMSEDPA